MKRNNGFTLTEVLLAVMIVAIIGVSLASLTTAATRESSLGSSKIILRNNLSTALRQIRSDIQNQNSASIHFYELPSTLNEFPVRMGKKVATLLSIKDGAYCFYPGDKDASPAGATSGGKITMVGFSDCVSVGPGYGEYTLLENVKFLPESSGYQVPVFKDVGGGGVFVRLILETPGSQPVSNVATEEIFFRQ